MIWPEYISYARSNINKIPQEVSYILKKAKKGKA